MDGENMSAFIVEFNTDNDVFVEAGPVVEIARILREVADRVENRESPITIRDVNGNTIGRAFQAGATRRRSS